MSQFSFLEREWPAVLEAAVFAAKHSKWDERPVAAIVVKEGQSVTKEELGEHLASRFAKFWLPERWSFITEVPKTSVGKFDKKVLRARNQAGELDVEKIA